MRKNSPVIVLLACMTWAALPAGLKAQSNVFSESRVFTNTDGRTLTAEIAEADATNVTLLLTDGRRAVVPLSHLSTADQTYTSSWISQHPAAIRYAFNIDWERQHLGIKSNHTGRIVESSQSQVVCHFSLTNRATVPLEAVEVNIRLYQKTLRGEDEYSEFTHSIPKMAAGETVKFDSEAIALNSTQFKGGAYSSNGNVYVYTTTGPLHNADSLRGFSAVVKHGGRDVYTTQSSGYKGQVDAAGKSRAQMVK